MNGTNNLNTNNVPASNEYVFRTNGRNSNGEEFNPNDDIWQFPLNGGKFDFTNIQEAATYEFFINSKKLMKVFLETGNYNTARTISIRFNKIVENIENKPINLISEADITAYLMRNNNCFFINEFFCSEKCLGTAMLPPVQQCMKPYSKITRILTENYSKK